MWSNKMFINKNQIIRINKLAFPILFTFLTSFIFNFADQAIIGRTSLEGYAAVSIISNIIYAIAGSLGVMGLCVNILGAGFLGSNDKKSYEKLFNTTMTFALVIGISIQSLILIFGKWFLQNILKMDIQMVELGYKYLYIAGIGIGINLILFILSAYFKAIEKANVFLIAGIVSNSVNIFFDYVLVFGKLGFPELGIAGASLGTVFGLATTLVFYIYYFIKAKDIYFKIGINKIFFRKLIRRYFPLVGQDILESTAFVIVISRMISQLGVLPSGIYGLTSFMAGIVMLPIYAFSNSSVTLIAKAKGGADKVAIKTLPTNIMISTIIVTTIIILPVIIFNKFLMRLITNDLNLISASSQYLTLIMIFQLINSVNHIYKNALNGINDERWVFRVSVLVSIICLIIIYVMAIVLEIGILGIFYGLGFNYILNSMIFFIRYNILIKRCLCALK